MTKQAVRDYCNKNGVRIVEKPTGAVRFVGKNIDVMYAGWEFASVRDLAAATPSPKSYGQEATTHGHPPL